MPEFLNREQLKEYLQNKIAGCRTDGANQAAIVLLEAYDFINRLPAADVAQVVHGEWVETGESPDDGNNWDYTCNKCGHRDTHAKSVVVNFCWFCGAKMDGGEHHG